MRRWILFACLILIPALGAVVPAAAQASTAAPGCQLNSEQHWNLLFPTAGGTITCTFATAPENGTAASQAAAHVTFQVSNFNFTNGAAGGGSTVDLRFYEPDKTLYKTVSFTGVGPPFYAFNPPPGTSNGPWSVDVAPEGAGTGTLTLTYAANVALGELSSTIPVPATIPVAGQWARTTFNATEGDKVTFRDSGYDSVDGQVFLVFYEPNGNLYGSPPPGGYYFTGTGPQSYTITTPAGSSGLWSAFLEPNGPAGAGLTLAMS